MGFSGIKRVILGEPLSAAHEAEQRISKLKALAVLSSDALSSVAYATEEILLPLAAFAATAVSWSMPIAIAIVILIIILTLSYRQTIDAYPNGGGAYIVAHENLGVYPGLVAGAALLIDYILTVAVSVAAGIAAITSAFPAWHEHNVALGIATIIVIMFLNLRGMKESATLFAAPTYFFILSIFLLLGVGWWKMMTGQIIPAAPILHEVYPEIAVFLLLRAFSSGCSALTGIEAISNGIPMFRAPVHRNAKITMTAMSALLVVMFVGITFLAHRFGVLPKEGETVVSILTRTVFGDSWIYYAIQGSTMLILVLAANTAYAGFPRLASLLAKDRFLPRQLASLGDRLVFSNGVMGLSLAAMALIVIFHGDPHQLVPLYAIGVFTSFTLSQMGMVVHHHREKEPGWIRSMVVNAVGAFTTLIVLLVIAVSKFTHGAWIVLILIPLFVFVFTRIYRHYLSVGKELSLIGVDAPEELIPVKHTVIVPISGIHRGVIEALRYALSISDDVRACYVEINPEATERVQKEWVKWAHQVPFVVLKSPYRSVIAPLIDYINDVEKISHDDMVTVIIPEFVTAKWRHRILHNQTALLIRAALAFQKGKVVTSVRYHLKHT